MSPDSKTFGPFLRMMNGFPSLLRVAALAFWMAACGGSGGGTGAGAVNQAPNAVFSVSVSAENPTLAIVFDASGSSDPDGTISSYHWNFGDGATASGVTANHTYTTGGTFTVTLTVTDDDGATARTSQTITANQAPNAVFSATATTGDAPLAIDFDASGSSDPDGTIKDYAWDFGDGATASGVTANHTYTTGGTFTVTLTVTDNDGATAETAQTITVTNVVRGTVTTSGTMVFDSDVNDPNAPYTSNDTARKAQAIASPATVGGYVNAAGSGDSGRSKYRGDPDDYYQVSLISGQTVVLYIGNTAAANLDLHLYDNNDATASPVSSALDHGPARSLTLNIAADDTYWIRVAADSGASTYTLFVGQSIAEAANDGLHSEDDFVAGQVIVRFKDGQMASAAYADGATLAETMGLDHYRGNRHSAMLMGFSGTAGRQRAFERLGVHTGQTDDLAAAVAPPQTLDKLDTLRIVRALGELSDVASADPNYIRATAAVPGDTYYNLQWHYPLIKLPEAWDATPGGNAVVVAVIDTGVLVNHPDLSGRLGAGYDFVSSVSLSNDGDDIDDDPDDPGDNRTGGSSFHGTHVAGTIAAATDNGTTGVAGVAYTRNVKVMPVRVLGLDGEGTSYDVMQGVRYAAGLENDSGRLPAQAAHVINLSLGGGGFSTTEQALFSRVRDAGIIVVAAAGNAASSAPTYPAAYDGVISVGAVDFNKELAAYSNYGATVDLAAPGGNTRADDNGDGNVDGILSTCGDDTTGTIQMTYRLYQGTSMATAHVSGVAALMKEIHPDLTPAGFDTLLQTGDLTEDIGTVGRDDRFGYGLIDAYKAVSRSTELVGGASLPAILTVTPTALSFGIDTASLTIVAWLTDGAPHIASVTKTKSWLFIAGPVMDGDQITYTVSVDRTGLAEGTYTDTLTFDTDGNDVKVPVTLQVSSITNTSRGYHYVLLIDADTGAVVAQSEGVMQNGSLTFAIGGVQPGTYEVYAGTDADNDWVIGGLGEAIGGYLSMDNPTPVIVEGNLSGIDFASQINTHLPATGMENHTLGHPLTSLKRMAQAKRIGS